MLECCCRKLDKGGVGMTSIGHGFIAVCLFLIITSSGCCGSRVAKSSRQLASSLVESVDEFFSRKS